MRPEEFRLIREFVAEEFGLLLDESRTSSLAMKLLPRFDELRLESFREYYAHLKYSPGGADEQQRFVSLVTNNETYFFREEPQLQVLADHVLPALKERKQQEGSKTIRVISAGCSSGEEVYTLAMILQESGHFLWDWEIRITGIDLDPQMICRANDGIYSGRAFQTTPPHYRERYFRRTDSGLQVKEPLRRMTSFCQGNLLCHESLRGDEPVDIIFCRNVFIYFSDETTRKIVDNFAARQTPEGLLFLGHSESLSRVSSKYVPVRFPGAIIYRKRD
jgi:chemotaxis protein methyltransferase CheR